MKNGLNVCRILLAPNIADLLKAKKKIKYINKYTFLEKLKSA